MYPFRIIKPAEDRKPRRLSIRDIWCGSIALILFSAIADPGTLTFHPHPTREFRERMSPNYEVFRPWAFELNIARRRWIQRRLSLATFLAPKDIVQLLPDRISVRKRLSDRSRGSKPAERCWPRSEVLWHFHTSFPPNCNNAVATFRQNILLTLTKFPLVRSRITERQPAERDRSYPRFPLPI